MKQKTKYIGMFAILSLVMVALAPNYIGEVDGSKGDDSPPTLGVLEGRQIIKDGLIINGQTFDVESFSQTIPAQSFDGDKQISITLLIHENSGIGGLEYVELALDVSGADSGSSRVSAVWNQKSDGTQTVEVIDYQTIFQVVKVQPKAVDDFNMSITFLFEHDGPVEIRELKVTMWDSQRNVWNNYFVVQ